MSNEPGLLPPLGRKRLSLAYWWVTHKYQLKQTRTLLLLIVDAGFLLFILYMFIQLMIGRQEVARIQAQILASGVNFDSYRAEFGAKKVTISEASVVRVDQNTVQLMVKLTNPNIYWGVSPVILEVKSGEESLGMISGYILPNEEKYLAADVANKEFTAGATTVEKVQWSWQRVANRDTFPAPRFTTSTPTIEIVDASLAPEPGKKKSSGTRQFHRVTATISNASVVGFQNVQVTGVLFRGDQPVAAKTTTLATLKSGEERAVEIIWPSVYSGVSRAVLYPSVDVFDEENVLRPLDTDIPGEF
ncbi:MAG: hypothetical protein HYV34_00955 [Candidatus Kerfeldbacteria bacterium]|nr:hypothetical protein [Candidatus Kerfeldbacteria bacterium]